MTGAILERTGEEAIGPSAPGQAGIELERRQHEIDTAREGLAESLKSL
jgi:hypothetical protein